MRSLSRPPLFSAVVALLGLACSGEPSQPSAGAGGMASQTGGMPGAGQATGGNATAGSNANGGSNATAGSTTTGGAGSASGGQAGASNAGSGGSAGSSGNGNGNGGTASGCSGVTSKFCDDFETQASGQPPKGDFAIDVKAGSSSIVVDSSKAYSGKQALHITTAKPTSTAFLNFTKQFPMNDFHGRAMFFLSRIPTAGIHWDLIDTVATNNQHWEIGGMYGKFIFVVDKPDHSLTSNTFPTGNWFCLQWQFKSGGASVDNTFLAQMDGTALPKGQFTGADPDGKLWDGGIWRQLSIGWTAYGQSEVDIEEWIDDLAIGDQPIACPAKP